MEKKRLQYLDRAKGLGILMVTMGHIMDLRTPLTVWMNLFKIAIFYVVSGWIAGLNPRLSEQSVGERMKKLLSSLMWPYFTLCMLSTLVRGFRKVMEAKDVLKMVRYDLFCTFTLRGVSALWFLPSMFVGQVLFFLVLKSRSRVLHLTALVVPLALSPYMMQWYTAQPDESLSQAVLSLLLKSLIVLWFTLMGYWGCLLFQRMPGKRADAALGCVMILGTFGLAALDPHINLNGLVLGKHPAIFFCGGLLGSFGFLLLFRALDDVLHEPFLSYWGRNSLILMGTQRGMTIINFVLFGMAGYVPLHDTVCPRYFLEMFFSFGVVLLMVYAVAELMNRYAPFFIHFPRRKREQRS